MENYRGPYLGHLIEEHLLERGAINQIIAHLIFYLKKKTSCKFSKYQYFFIITFLKFSFLLLHSTFRLFNYANLTKESKSNPVINAKETSNQYDKISTLPYPQKSNPPFHFSTFSVFI